VDPAVTCYRIPKPPVQALFWGNVFPIASLGQRQRWQAAAINRQRWRGLS